MARVVIIGNGIAGVTAARNIRKLSNEEILIISSEGEEFFARTSLMYVYMGHLPFKDIVPYEKEFWSKNRIELLQDHVNFIDTKSKQLELSSNNFVSYDQLIIASGSKSNFIKWKGYDLKGVQGLYFKQDLDEMESNTKNISEAAIIGGGLIGLEMAEMLLSRGIEVHFIIRDEFFWSGAIPKEDSKFLMKHIAKYPNLHMHYKSELEEIIGDENGRVKMIKTKEAKEIPAQFVGISIGVIPNISFLKDSEISCNKGVLVNEFLQTSAKDVYAIGDCAELKSPKPGRKAIDQVWYTGRIMGKTVANTICGNPIKYDPGNWYNSAKFFDVEYQCYGNVPTDLEEEHNHFVWQHAEKEVLIHFVFEKSTDKFLGVNAFGIRLRHELFDNWLTNNYTIDEVISNLIAANFDPEFYKSFEKDIISSFNEKYDRSVKLKKQEWWRNLLIKEQ